MVGTIDDVVVGYAMASVEVLPDGGRLAALDGALRRTGRAARSAWASCCSTPCSRGRPKADASASTRSSLPGNRETKNFFEAAGMVARAIIVHASCDRRSPATQPVNRSSAGAPSLARDG